MDRNLRFRILVVTLGFTMLTARPAVADSGWFWQNPLPQGNGLLGTAVVDADTVYVVGIAGTVLRSTDGGVNWSIQATNNRQQLRAISCTDASTCTAVGVRGTILRTTNGGAIWTAQSSGTQDDYLLGVSFTDANTGTVSGQDSTGSIGSILRTINGGATWTRQSTGTTGLWGVSCTDANTCTAVGGSGTIVRTTNGGATWTRQSSGTTDYLVGASFIDANTGTVVGNGGTILHTINGGVTWTIQTIFTMGNLYGVSCTDANTCTAVGSGIPGTILRTTNGGATWTRQDSGTTEVLIGVSFADAETGTAVGSFGRILRTTDGGVTWTIAAPTYVATRDDLYGVSCTYADTCTAVGGARDLTPPYDTHSTIVHTINGGATWTLQSSGITNRLRAISCTDANTCTAVGEHGTILRTTNGGTTWPPQSSGTTDGLAGVSCTDANTCTAVGGAADATSFYGTRATILRTTNGGATWTPQAPSGDPNDQVPELFGVSCIDANTCTAVGAYSAILRTYDGGAYWSDEGLNTMPSVWSVSMTDVETGMAATDRNILRANPPGTPWTPVFGEGAFGISCTDANTCTAVGSYDTILHTTNGGVNWTHEPIPSSYLLFAVSCTDADTCTAVGQSGTILRTNTGGR
jgi:photosystem II stability/assembly factor-like uncharacterized protein